MKGHFTYNLRNRPATLSESGYKITLYYVLTDRLGSWEKVMDDFKNTVQQTHFDPWGNRMSYTAWNTRQTQVAFPFSLATFGTQLL